MIYKGRKPIPNRRKATKPLPYLTKTLPYLTTTLPKFTKTLPELSKNLPQIDEDPALPESMKSVP